MWKLLNVLRPKRKRSGNRRFLKMDIRFMNLEQRGEKIIEQRKQLATLNKALDAIRQAEIDAMNKRAKAPDDVKFALKVVKSQADLWIKLCKMGETNGYLDAARKMVEQENARQD